MHFDELKKFYEGKCVLVTGHTGFKGSWLARMLTLLGARVCGYALEPAGDASLYGMLNLDEDITSVIADIRDFERLRACFEDFRPEIVFHLAAQPLVRDSYREPRYTYETNVMGTVNVLECMRLVPGVKSFLNVTTDKVYENSEQPGHGFREDEKLDGYDPYSNSKSCSELVTHAYAKSFFAAGAAAQKVDDRTCPGTAAAEKEAQQADGAAAYAAIQVPRISTARAGNVIGGGDFAADRIVPDCVRAACAGRSIVLRNPNSTRPYQHVLEPLSAYLMIALRQTQQAELAGSYNVGPMDGDCITTGALADLFVKYWGDGCSWHSQAEANAPHEANFLKLDCAKLRAAFGWKPVWGVDEAVRRTVAWYRAWAQGEDMAAFTERQILDFLK